MRHWQEKQGAFVVQRQVQHVPFAFGGKKFRSNISTLVLVVSHTVRVLDATISGENQQMRSYLLERQQAESAGLENHKPKIFKLLRVCKL